MNKQTALQWFALKVMHLKMNPKEAFEFIEWFDQAKEMEKEQIKEAWIEGFWEVDCRNADSEQYYKETYGEE
jgi:hypothetical protein